jgi:hypothetical protein
VFFVQGLKTQTLQGLFPRHYGAPVAIGCITGIMFIGNTDKSHAPLQKKGGRAGASGASIKKNQSLKCDYILKFLSIGFTIKI